MASSELDAVEKDELGPMYEIAFRLSVVNRTISKGGYHVWTLRRNLALSPGGTANGTRIIRWRVNPLNVAFRGYEDDKEGSSVSVEPVGRLQRHHQAKQIR